MTGDNAPPLDGWAVTPRACPFDTDCRVCSAAYETAETPDEPHLIRGTE